MAIYKVPPKPPKLVHTKLVCNDSTKEKWQKLAFRTFVSMLSVCLGEDIKEKKCFLSGIA